MNRAENSRDFENRNADQGRVDVCEEPVVDQIENGSVPGLLDAIYTRMSIPIDPKMDEISSKSPKESELDSEAGFGDRIPIILSIPTCCGTRKFGPRTRD